MTTMELPTTATMDLARPRARLAAETATTSASSGREASGSKTEWALALRVLEEWWSAPTSIADDEIVPPSRDIIELAFRLAAYMRDEGAPSPLRIVPDGEGGIVFERRYGDLFETIELASDESISKTAFKHGQFVGRCLVKPGRSTPACA
jgi:hypothetical protein